MNQPELRQHDTPEALAADAAEHLLVTLRDAQAAGRVPQVCLTGGTIAETLHEILGSVGPDGNRNRPSRKVSGVRWGPARCSAV